MLEVEKAQPLDALGKEKADVTHIRCNLNPQDARKVKADDESDYESVGAHNWQSQNEQQTHERKNERKHE